MVLLLQRMNFVHLIPFVLHGMFMTFKYHIHSADIERTLLAAVPLFDFYEEFIIDAIYHFLVLSCIIASLGTVRVYGSKIKKDIFVH